MEPLERETIIWEGRFQPVHLGHVGYIRHLLSRGMPAPSSTREEPASVLDSVSASFRHPPVRVPGRSEPLRLGWSAHGPALAVREGGLSPEPQVHPLEAGRFRGRQVEGLDRSRDKGWLLRPDQAGGRERLTVIEGA